MSTKHRYIPFHWLPASWGLVGQPYDEAKAHYLYEGEDLERRLIDIRYRNDPAQHAAELVRLDHRLGHIDAYQQDRRLLELDGPVNARAALALDLRHDRISAYEHDRALALLDYPDEGTERELALLDVELVHQRVSKNHHAKTRATLLREPWVDLIDHGFNLEEGIGGVYFEFDWNSFWITYLRLHGYSGDSEDAIIEQWFADVCRSLASEVRVEVASLPLLHQQT